MKKFGASHKANSYIISKETKGFWNARFGKLFREIS